MNDMRLAHCMKMRGRYLHRVKHLLLGSEMLNSSDVAALESLLLRVLDYDIYVVIAFIEYVYGVESPTRYADVTKAVDTFMGVDGL